MALFTTINIRDFDEAGAVKKNVKLGDKIYTGDDQAYMVQSILNKYNLYAAQRTIDVAGKNVHEFTIRLRPVEQIDFMPTIQIDHLLQPHYEVELAS
ncbi:hypothetical protein [Mucilaginibacter sp.]|uniref:hypothetical protein n=1 Tax=Mucilaginibacter sp. TaxID=1882438 RepID=UPI0035BC3782